MKRFLTTGEAAEYLKKMRFTLCEWRKKNIGPPFVRFGPNILYDVDSINAWLAKHTINPDDPGSNAGRSRKRASRRKEVAA